MTTTARPRPTRAPDRELGRVARPPFRAAHGAAGGHRAALLRDLSADHLGLSVAVALRAGAGRLHAELHRPAQFQEAAHRLAAIPPARHLRRARRVHWLVLGAGRRGAALLFWPATSARPAHRARHARPAVIVGGAGAVRSPLVAVATFAPGGVPGTRRQHAALRRRRRHRAVRCSGSAWRCSAASRSAAATSSACCSSFR